MIKQLPLILTCACAMQASLSAATIIALTAGSVNAPPQYGSAYGNVLTDGFAYDPLDPTSASPTTAWSPTTHYHANQPPVAPATTFTVVGNFTMNHTITTTDPIVVFDIWGRTGSNGSYDRDDSYQVELFDNLGNSLGIQSSGIDNTSYDRVTFTGITAGTIITDMVFRGFDSEGTPPGNNNFTIAELRLAAVPEPSSTLMLGLSGLALLARRRR